jgi:Tfp pilus assembly protein PilF
VLLPFVALLSAAPSDGQTTADPAVIERQLTEAVRREPDSFQAHHALGELYIHQGKLSAAIPHLERARALDPAHYANGYDLSLAYLETNRLDAARDQVRRMLDAKPTGELHNLLAEIEARAGNPREAAEHFQRAAHLDASEDHLFDWGDFLLQLRAFEPAAQVFVAGLERYPKSARLHVGLGIAEYSRGRYDEAVKSMCRAADLAPLDPRPIQFLGEMYGVSPELSGEVTERLARFVKAKPRDAAGHYFYAMNLWKGQAPGREAVALERIETLLRKSVTLDPKLAKAHLQLGILLSEQRRWPEAVVELKKAVALEPAVAQTHFRLAQAYQRTHQKELADKELEIFEKLKAQESAPPVPR